MDKTSKSYMTNETFCVIGNNTSGGKDGVTLEDASIAYAIINARTHKTRVDYAILFLDLWKVIVVSLLEEEMDWQKSSTIIFAKMCLEKRLKCQVEETQNYFSGMYGSAIWIILKPSRKEAGFSVIKRGRKTH